MVFTAFVGIIIHSNLLTSIRFEMGCYYPHQILGSFSTAVLDVLRSSGIAADNSLLCQDWTQRIAMSVKRACHTDTVGTRRPLHIRWFFWQWVLMETRYTLCWQAYRMEAVGRNSVTCYDGRRVLASCGPLDSRSQWFLAVLQLIKLANYHAGFKKFVDLWWSLMWEL